jgi:hypothetical protein
LFPTLRESVLACLCQLGGIVKRHSNLTSMLFFPSVARVCSIVDGKATALRLSRFNTSPSRSNANYLRAIRGGLAICNWRITWAIKTTRWAGGSQGEWVVRVSALVIQSGWNSFSLASRLWNDIDKVLLSEEGYHWSGRETSLFPLYVSSVGAKK